MKIPRLSYLAALVATVALGAFACASNETKPTGGEVATQTEEAAPMEDGEILQVLQTINEAQINHAQLVIERSDNPLVIDTAETVLEDHRALNERIDQIAQEIDAELAESELSRELNTQASQFEEELTGLSGAEFDRAYMRRQVELHELAIQTAREDLMASATEPQVSQLLSEVADNLEMNLQVAEQRSQELEDSAIGGGPEEGEEEQPDDVEIYERY